MLESYTKYYLTCDACGDKSEEAEGQHDVWMWAKTFGWQSRGLETFCPDCSLKLNKEV